MPTSAELLAPLASWFEQARRDLPWRDTDLDRPHPDPYAVLVSELMLQQTQVATVLPYFQRWMARFPDAASLAEAEEDEVHKFWEGLGYYRRARHLQAAARRIAETGWPADLAGLAELPGLGPYTAAAVASIAFQWPEPALDGNVFRVLARLHGEPQPRSRAEPFRAWLRPALRRLGPSRLTQALMELGALICLPKSPRCADCPLAEHCQGLASGAPLRFPAPVLRAAPKDVELWLVAVEAEGHFLLERPGTKGLLAGLWRWPAVEPEPMALQAAEPLEAYGSAEWTAFQEWTQIYSHRREAVHPFQVKLPHRSPPPPDRSWVAQEDLGALPMGSRDQRLRLLVQDEARPARSAKAPAWLLPRILN